MDPALLSAFRQRVLAGIEVAFARETAQTEAYRSTILPLVSSVIQAARARKLCARAWLFGSFAWGRPGDRSDVDVLVEDCADPDSLAVDIWRATERPAHVLGIEDAPVTLVERVLREGHPL